MTITRGDFKLRLNQGEFTDSQIIVMLGENGTGKTTFIKMLAGSKLDIDEEGSQVHEIPQFSVSYKNQHMSNRKFEITVRDLIHRKIPNAYAEHQFVSDVMKPLKIEELMDKSFNKLSGGEKQRVALALCLGKSADIYLIDEPSAFLDSEQRIIASKVIKRFILQMKKAAFARFHNGYVFGK